MIGAFFFLLIPTVYSQDDHYLQKIKAWRIQRNESLQKPYGWLSISGLTWLIEGKTLTVGSDTDSAIKVDHRFPKKIGEFSLYADHVVFRPDARARVQFQSKMLQNEIKIPIDKDSDFFQVSDLSFQIIKRDMGVGVRLRDPKNQTRKKFKGLKFFPVHSLYRLQGKFIADIKPTKVLVSNSLGADAEMTRVGIIEFVFDGKKQKLIAFQDEGNLFIIFKDLTSGKQTYGAGRFLEVELPNGDSVILDFNFAYNPPCAFNKFTTCPLPPRENSLVIPILAGEKYSKN